MSIRHISTSMLGVLAICGAVAAQTPPAPPASQKTPSDLPSVSLAGCVQKESAVLKRNPAAGNIGMDDEFVLTFAAVTPATGETPKAEVKPSPAAGGTPSAPGNFGRVYRVTGEKESELKNYVGQRVQITGTFKNKNDAADAMSSVGTTGRTGDLTPANTPELTITTVTPASGTCAPVVK
jgi:hypothetical protein